MEKCDAGHICLIGIGRFGLRVLKRARSVGGQTRLVHLDRQRGLFKLPEEPNIRQLELEEDDLLQLSSVLSGLFSEGEQSRFIIVGGLGGRTTYSLLDPIASLCSSYGVEHFCVGVFPFCFEGKARNHQAISLVRRMEKYTNFKYFDCNLVVREYNGKINLGVALDSVENILWAFVLGLLKQGF